MAVQPQQLDPLPIPETQAQPDVSQDLQRRADGGTGGALPPYTGWVSKTGAGAYVANQVLTGWMAGRHHAQQTALEKAKLDISGSRTAYDVTAESYKNLIDQGLDPNKPEDAKKLEAAKIAAQSAWSNYLDRSEKYSFPDDGKGKKKKSSAKEGIQHAFMGQSPEFFAKSSVDILRKSGAPVLSYGTSKDEKQKQQLNEQTLKQNEQAIKLNDEQLAKNKDIETLQKQYQDAIKSGDDKAKQTAREGLAGYGVNVQKVESQTEAQLSEELAKTKLSALKTLEQPGKTTSDLTVAERSALGIQLGGLDIYLNEVGPGKKFKSAIDAQKGYLHDQAAANAIAGASAQERQWNDMKRAEASVLQHDLQDPEKAKEAGLPAPLKPGQAVPDWLINKAVMGRLKPSPEERQAAKTNVDKSISTSINNVLGALPAEDQKFARENLVDYDPETKTYTLKGEAPERKSHWFKGDTVGGLSTEEYTKKRNAFLERLSGYIVKTAPGASKQRILSALQSGDPSEALVGGATPAPQALEPPPGVAKPLEQPKGKYHVSAGGQTQEIEMTADEAEAIKQQFPDATIEFVYSRPLPHGR